MRLKLTTVSVVAALVLTITSCDDKFRSAVRAADTIAGTIDQTIDVKRQLAQQNKITRDEELSLTNALLKANTADKAFVDGLKKLSGTPTASDKSTLAPL